MEDANGTPENPLAREAGESAAQTRAALFDALARAPERFDFFQALRRIELLGSTGASRGSERPPGPRRSRFGSAKNRI